MTEPNASTEEPRLDIDIERDIDRAMSGYPPLRHDRHRINVDLRDGVVTVSGYVKTPMTQSYLLEQLSQVEGVRQLIADDLYNDADIRLDVGQVVPPGVIVVPEYGAVILTGYLPEDASVAELVEKIAQVPGVHRVVTAFR